MASKATIVRASRIWKIAVSPPATFVPFFAAMVV